MKMILAVTLGVVIGVLLLEAIQAWLLALQPPSADWNVQRAQAFADWMTMLNGRYKLMLLGAWMSAGAAGGALSAAIARHPAAGWLCGLLLAASAILLTSLVTPPYWMAALLVLSPLTGAVIGAHVFNLIRGAHP